MEAKVKTVPHVTEVEPRRDHTLLVTFVGGERRVFDLGPHLDREVFQALKDWEAFEQVRVVRGSVEWPGGQDLHRSTLYLDGTEL